MESKSDKKVKRAAQKLFSNQLLNLKNQISELPIDLSFEHNSTNSNWRNNRNKQYHWLFSFARSNTTAAVEFILSFWDHYSSHNKEIFKPLLKSLVELEKVSNKDRSLTRGTINEEMYTMF